MNTLNPLMANVTCSNCGKRLEYIGNWMREAAASGSSLSVMGSTSFEASISDMDQWKGVFCSHCNKVFCEKCMVAAPGPCPICGRYVVPATYSAIKSLLNARCSGKTSQREGTPHAFSEVTKLKTTFRGLALVLVIMISAYAAWRHLARTPPHHDLENEVLSSHVTIPPANDRLQLSLRGERPTVAEAEARADEMEQAATKARADADHVRAEYQVALEELRRLRAVNETQRRDLDRLRHFRNEKLIELWIVIQRGILEREMEYARLSEQFGEQHPTMRRLEAEIDTLKQRLSSLGIPEDIVQQSTSTAHEIPGGFRDGDP